MVEGNKRKLKYQILKITIPIQAGGVYVNVPIAVDTDKLYKKVKHMFMYASTNITANKNLVVMVPIKVSGIEVYPENFDTAFLFPNEDNLMLGTTEVNEKAEGSRVEGQVQYQANTVAAFDVKIILVLSDE